MGRFYVRNFGPEDYDAHPQNWAITQAPVSGFEVCRILRQTHSMERLPVLFLTVKNQTSDVVAGLSLGANDYLTKPIERDELLARLRPHLDLLEFHHRLEGLVEEKVSHIKVYSELQWLDDYSGSTFNLVERITPEALS